MNPSIMHDDNVIDGGSPNLQLTHSSALLKILDPLRFGFELCVLVGSGFCLQPSSTGHCWNPRNVTRHHVGCCHCNGLRCDGCVTQRSATLPAMLPPCRKSVTKVRLKVEAASGARANNMDGKF